MIRTFIAPILAGLLLSMIVVSAGEIPRPATGAPQEFLPETIDQMHAKRSGELLIFRGDSLSQYTNSADFYQRFDFIDLATTEYTVDSAVMVIDISRFGSPEDAYGIYSHLRWGNADNILAIGIEAFELPVELSFVKGAYVVTIIGFSDAEAAAKMLRELAAYIAESLPGSDRLPEPFDLFPHEGAIAGTAMYFPDQFLRLDFLKRIYASNFLVGSDTLYLFLAVDSAVAMAERWRQTAEADSSLRGLPKGIPYDGGRGFTVEHQRYGNIIIGTKNDVLAVMIGYDPRHRDFLVKWLNSLLTPTE